MPPGRYWFAMTRRSQQTGWATPAEVAQDVPYNPYSDPYHVSARVAPDPITFVGLPPENYKESALSSVVEIVARDPWSVAQIHVSKNNRMRPEYYQTTSEAQQGRPFPIASQTYDAFYISADRGVTWKLYDSRPSRNSAYAFESDFSRNNYANPNTMTQVMGGFPSVGTTKVFSAPPVVQAAKPTTPTPWTTILVVLLLLALLACGMMGV